MVNLPDEGLVYEACVFLPGHKPLGHRDAFPLQLQPLGFFYFVKTH